MVVCIRQNLLLLTFTALRSGFALRKTCAKVVLVLVALRGL